MTHFLPSNEDVNLYAQDGAVVLRGLFSESVESLRAGIEALKADPSPLERSYMPDDGTAQFFQDLCNWQRIPEFRDFVLNSQAGAVAARLMGSRTGRFFHDHVLVKEPGSSIATPWHQDAPYYCTEGKQSVSLWIPLDPVPKENALRCVAGSHLWDRLHKPKRFNGQDLYEDDDRDEVPDIDGDPDRFRVLSWAVEPGDAVAFNFRTIHGAAANTGRSARRRVFSARWVGDDARFADRGGKGSPPFKHLKLENGAPLDGPDFPVVFRR